MSFALVSQRALTCLLAACVALASVARCAEPSTSRAPDWLYPLNAPSSVVVESDDHLTPVHVPGSAVTYTQVQLNDLFSPPDWFPASHSAMPDVVAHGRQPDVFACGYCHAPGGQGRPENASLAGLPAPYIIQQLADFKSGARRSAGPDAFLPAIMMLSVAAHASDDEVAAAADYFSQQKPVARVHVIETAQVPRAKVAGWVYVADPHGGRESLGQRLLEFTPDAGRHENRDDTLQYVAYVPIGSLKRGSALALSGAGLTQACVSCHGGALQGVGLTPPLAGRSPSYLIRQLLAFQTGARAGPNAQLMLPVVARMAIGDMIDIAAYTASLNP